MTRLQPLLDQIERTLAECNAADLPPLIKLTREQLDEIRAVSAHPPAWQRGAAIPGFAGVPIKLVDTVEESTPYELRHPKPAQQSWLRRAGRWFGRRRRSGD